MQRTDVFDVLAGDLGDRDIQDVEVLPADQVQQQIQRALERFENDLQRVRRDVQVQRNLQHRLPAQQRQRHFLLLRCDDVRGLLWIGHMRCLRRGRGRIGHQNLFDRKRVR